MKNKLMYVGICLIVLLLVAGCTGSSGKASLEGRWIVNYMEIDGEYDLVAGLYDMAEEEGEEFDPVTLWYYEFTKNGKVTSVFEENQIAEGTYKLKENKLTLSIDGGTAEATMEEDSFYFETVISDRIVNVVFVQE